MNTGVNIVGLSKSDKCVLESLLKYCNDIADDVKSIRGVESLIVDEYTRRLLDFSIFQIGELVQRELSKEYKESHSKISWESVVSTHRMLMHSDTRDSTGVVWRTAVLTIPKLRDFIAKDLEEVACSLGVQE